MKINSNSTAVILTACAIIFCLFTFCYTYFYQSDVLMADQFVLSDGQTKYYPLTAAILITVVLQLLQLLVRAFFRLYKSGHALTYLPSLLALAVITSGGKDIDKQFSFGPWWWIVPILLMAFVFAAFILRQIQEVEMPIKGPLLVSRCMWVNMLTLFVMFFLVGVAGNSDKVFHERMKMERLLLENNPEEALEVGKKSYDTDSCLTLLRVHALAKTNQLGERLFEYPIVGGAAAMTPNGNSVRTLMYPAKDILVQKKKSAVDYQLCEHLLNKDLKAFASLLVRTYPLNKPLPKHYREALYLYGVVTPYAQYKLHDNVIAADYADFKKLQRQTPDKDARQAVVRDVYGKTYWYYFFYKE